MLLASFIQVASVYQHTSEYFLILLRLEERPDERVQMPPQLSVTYACFSSSGGHNGQLPPAILRRADRRAACGHFGIRDHWDSISGSSTWVDITNYP